MSAKHAAVFAAIFGGAGGGLLTAGLAQYLSHDVHWLPLLAGTILGGTLAGLLTALVTRDNFSKDSADRQ
jgi:hypothetical protein